MKVFRTEAGKSIVRSRYDELLAKWPVPCERRYVGETHVIECGPESAAPLILPHGWEM